MRKDTQSEISKHQAICYGKSNTNIGKVGRFRKKFLSFSVCCSALFLTWFLMLQISSFFTNQFFSPQESFLVAIVTTFLSCLFFYLKNKIQNYYSDFKLIKLFAKSSSRKRKSKSQKTAGRVL